LVNPVMEHPMISLKTYHRLCVAFGVFIFVFLPLVLVIGSIMSIVELASGPDPMTTKLAIGLLLMACVFLPVLAAMWPGFRETVRTGPPD